MQKLKCLLQPVSHSVFGSSSILFLRLVAGSAFMFHGWKKIQNPFGWMPPDAGIPGFIQSLAALSEFGGGLAWILGLLTPLASLGIACTMAVATHMHMIIRKDPFVNLTGGPSYELALVFLSISIVLLALGPGRFSFDRIIFGYRGTKDQIN